MKAKRNRLSKHDDLATTIKKLTGQRNAKQRWRYTSDEELTNAQIILLAHMNLLNKETKYNLKIIAQLKEERKQHNAK